MRRISIFLRDTRGVAIADYAAVAALVALLRDMALRHGEALGGALRHLIG